jgi:signal peptidase II
VFIGVGQFATERRFLPRSAANPAKDSTFIQRTCIFAGDKTKYMYRKRLFWLFLPILPILALDRWTKAWATAHLMNAYPRSYQGDVFRLQYALNEGAFLSLGADLHEGIRYWVLAILPVAVLLYICYYAITAPTMTPWSQAAFGFILGGGGSNIYDRIAAGHVVDFMNMGIGNLRTGIFNVADVAIMTGLVMMVATIFSKPPVVEEKDTEVPAESLDSGDGPEQEEGSESPK